MPQTPPNTRPPTAAELSPLIPLRGLSADLLKVLCRHCDVLSVPKGAHLKQSGKELKYYLFLLQGELLLRDRDGEIQALAGGTVRAGFPLVAEGGATLDAKCRKNCDLLRLPLKSLQSVRALAEQKALAEQQAEAKKTDRERLEDRITEDFRAAVEGGRMQLPGLPEVAARISSHIDSPRATSTSIARIVQTDPAVTARLIQVSNSVAYGARTPVKTGKDAVTRLGRTATRELVTSFVLKGLFRTRAKEVKLRMRELWKHSTEVAALCHVLAKRSPGLEPERAMLIGLVHDIGVIPILSHAHRYAGLAEDPALLDQVIADLRGELGRLTMRGWGFGDEFVDAAVHAEDWQRDAAPEPDYTDLVIIAQLHAYLRTPRMQELPRIDQVPAFAKLALGELSPRMSLAIVDEAQQEIEEVQLLLM